MEGHRRARRAASAEGRRPPGRESLLRMICRHQHLPWLQSVVRPTSSRATSTRSTSPPTEASGSALCPGRATAGEPARSAPPRRGPDGQRRTPRQSGRGARRRRAHDPGWSAGISFARCRSMAESNGSVSRSSIRLPNRAARRPPTSPGAVTVSTTDTPCRGPRRRICSTASPASGSTSLTRAQPVDDQHQVRARGGGRCPGRLPLVDGRGHGRENPSQQVGVRLGVATAATSGRADSSTASRRRRRCTRPAPHSADGVGPGKASRVPAAVDAPDRGAPTMSRLPVPADGSHINTS